ncbi:helix-turn-helix transcriptional regulator [Trinickia caryophylli]|uniref:Transcriptional regulator, XRE family n=1 Tax=Trinickia caryophylli TaxID=28094 RepID=A0A1X7GJP4_TRICW|nr:helix-turn-helix transcriptional regulator [Trinickia caryophylli]PMS09921.1 XRE family transcriptional regulator [Trinickia caryophylli]TRX14958.1 helix-turn-helix domain-containing protein [Trinickia caryophylli]WQE14814.1 helix-turn-helix transcriptional regulator [Trinickia caryophylli]SMF70740.1 transcriptional regulator, XRE family [Trinickia caryophylli]GLU35015.1 transcriptional regulator [Trinickia caryophylli]
MAVTTLPEPVITLGSFLRERRARLHPGPDTQGRRRTPGLRREEVAARANVSVAWYTWLEQGRGGPPSAEVLERLARALELDATGREMLFLLGQQRPPPVHRTAPPPVTPALQRVLDGMPASPAIVKTATWDVVAWNAAAAAVLSDYAQFPPNERNVLRRLFLSAEVRAALPDWEENARTAVAVFRIDVARAGGSGDAAALAAELQATSEDFRRLWADNEVGSFGFGTKRLRHPRAGLVTLEYSAFSVDAAKGLTLIVFAPASPADSEAIATIVAEKHRQGR